jgi:hypothetical protein
VIWWWAACEREPARPRPDPRRPPAPVYTTPPDPLVGSCEDLVIPERPPRNAHRASDVRTSWIKGDRGAGAWGRSIVRQGQLVADALKAPDDDRVSGYRDLHAPLRPAMTSGDAVGFVAPRDPGGAVGASVERRPHPGPGEELLIASDQG